VKKLSLDQPQFSEREQLVVRLREQEKQRYEEIAAQLGVSHHRVQQIYAGVRARRKDFAAKGKDSLLLLPGHARTVLGWLEITTRAQAREAIESGRLKWDNRWRRFTRDGQGLRQAGWKTWVVIHEWAGLPRPEPQKLIVCPHCGKSFEP
jgi:hypothetical protein